MRTKAKGKLLAILMSLAMVFTMMPMMSQTAHAWTYGTVGYLKYILEDDGTATVSGYTDKMPADVTVPAEIVSGGETYAVVGIEGYVFKNCANLESVTIPNSVTSIGFGAFQASGITNIAFENGSIIEEIGDGAFSDCYSLTSITIPNSVTSIGGTALRCNGLTSVVIPSGVTTIGWGAFSECNSLKTVYYVGTKDQWDNMTGRDSWWAGGRENDINIVFVDKAADVPTGKTLIYNGKEQTGVDAGEGYTLSDGVVKATNVGTYTVTATKQAGYEVWMDGTTTDTRTVTWEIKKAIEKVPAPEVKPLTYNGKTQTGVEAGTGYTLSGTASAVKAGTYKATATLNEHPNPNYRYAWADGSTDPIEIKWKIDKAIAEDKVAIPVSRNFTYNGKTQTGVAAGANYTLSGTVKATKAGTYTAKATLKTNANYTYKWSDGTTAPKTIKWTINKAANPLKIKAKTATVKYSKLEKKNQTLAVGKVITFTKKGQGKMTYTMASGNKKITIAKTTGKVTVKKGLKKGTYKVKVKVKAAGNANYKASAAKTVTFKIRVK